MHIRSLRLRPSELFVVCDGEGLDYMCRLSDPDSGGGRHGRKRTKPTPANEADTGSAETYSVPQPGQGKNAALAEIVEIRPSVGEPSVKCSVFIGLAKGDRLDYAVQKSIELGAYEIILFPSKRTVAVPKDIEKKALRFQRIAIETAKQCGRGIVPQVRVLSSFELAVELAVLSNLPLFLYENEFRMSLKQALEQSAAATEAQDGLSIAIMTGPEGGFDPHEAELAVSKGMLAVTLGPRILRCETAPAATLAAVMFHTNNLA